MKGDFFMGQTNINIRMDEELKRDFDRLCGELGLNMTAAFNIFARTVVRQRGIPFPVALDGTLPRMPLGIADISHEEFVAEIEKGIASAKAGRVKPVDEVREKMERRYEL